MKTQKVSGAGTDTISNAFKNDDFEVKSFGKKVAFKTPEGVSIGIESSGACLIELPQSYKNKVTGLCGNFDGDAANDLALSPDASAGGSVNDTDPGNSIGNSWFIANEKHPDLR